MNKEIAETYFETVYKEYKEYENFFKNKAPEIKKKREDFTQFVVDNKEDVNKITERLFENEVLTQFYKNDLVNLKNRLFYTYKALKDLIEIPPEVKNEIEVFIQPPQYFIIKANEAVEVDKEQFEKQKNQAKEHYQQSVENVVKTLNNPVQN